MAAHCCRNPGFARADTIFDAHIVIGTAANATSVSVGEIENIIKMFQKAAGEGFHRVEACQGQSSETVRIAQELEHVGKVDQLPKLEGKRMIMMMSPKKPAK